MELNSFTELKTTHQSLIHEALEKGDLIREERWTESIAVGSQSFVEGIKRKLGAKGKYRVVLQKNESWEIQEETNTIRGYSDPKMD